MVMWERISLRSLTSRGSFFQLRLDRFVGCLPLLFVPIHNAPFAIRLDRKIDYNLGASAGIDIQVRLLTSADALQEVLDVRRHHIFLIDRDLDIFSPKFSRVCRTADGAYFR